MLQTVKIYKTEIQLKTAFVHARASRDVSENIVVIVDLDGHIGIGECVPRDYVTGESPDSVFDVLSHFDFNEIKAISSEKSFLGALNFIEKIQLPGKLIQNGHLGMAASCAVELALLDALGKKFSTPAHQIPKILGLPSRDLNTKKNDNIWSLVFHFGSNLEDFTNGLPPGINCIKLKTGKDSNLDIEKVKRIRQLFGNEVFLCLDVNMAWSLDQALELETLFRPHNISWYEEPLAQFALADYATFRKKTGAKIMLDESLCSFQQGEAAIQNNSCDIFNIRISKCGGILNSLRLVALADANGLGYSLGAHPGQNGVLLAASKHFAHSVPKIVTQEGLGKKGSNNEKIIVTEKVGEPNFDWSEVFSSPGLGVHPNLDVIDQSQTRQFTWLA